MKKTMPVTCLFLDIGGVLLTNGWDHHARKRAATHFKLEWAEMEDRHRLNCATYEEGTLTLEEYRGREVFYRKPVVRLGSIWTRHVGAIDTVPRDNRAGPQAQSNVQIEDRRGQ